MTIRKKYPKEFKLDAISLVLEQGYGVTEAANKMRSQLKETVAPAGYVTFDAVDVNND